jgi:hypothetical protein
MHAAHGMAKSIGQISGMHDRESFTVISMGQGIEQEMIFQGQDQPTSAAMVFNCASACSPEFLF